MPFDNIIYENSNNVSFLDDDYDGQSSIDPNYYNIQTENNETSHNNLNEVNKSGETAANSNEKQFQNADDNNNNINENNQEQKKNNNNSPKKEASNNIETNKLEFMQDKFLTKIPLEKEVADKFMINSDISTVLKKGEEKAFNEKTTKKIGRKNKKDDSERAHNKYSSDNIIKTIKGKLISYCRILINRIIISGGKNKKILKKLNYEIIDEMKKEDNLKLLDSKLKVIFSNRNSIRGKESSDSYNKNMIEDIYNKINDNNKILKEVLDLTFDQWYKYFTYQEELEFLGDFAKNNNITIKRAEDLLNKIGKEEESGYFTKFTYYLFYYKDWFSNKKGRKSKKRGKKKIDSGNSKK